MPCGDCRVLARAGRSCSWAMHYPSRPDKCCRPEHALTDSVTRRHPPAWPRRRAIWPRGGAPARPGYLLVSATQPRRDHDMQVPQTAPGIDVVLDGFGINTSAGLVSMCEVVLIEGPGRDGRPTRILVDPAHVGRRTFLLDALAARGLTPGDIDMVLLTHAHWDHMQNIDLFE